jgi:hypothetical protein
MGAKMHDNPFQRAVAGTSFALPDTVAAIVQ